MDSPPFHGIIPPLVTPLDERRQVDLGGLDRLVERLVTAPVHGLFVLGTTGEGPSLTQPAQQTVVSAVCDQVAGRLPVLVGITNPVVAHSLEIAEAAYSAGASAVVFAPPYYFPMSQAELLDYSQQLVARLPLPVMLYNMPGCCKTWFDVETVGQLSQIPQVLGLKDSSGDLDFLKCVVERVAERNDFALFVGPEEILVSAMRIGAHGGVHGGANMFPRLYTEMYRTAAVGDWSEAERLQQAVLTVSQSIYTASEGPSRIIKGIKTVLDLLGICSDQMAEPFRRHDESSREQIRIHLDRLLAELGTLAQVTRQGSLAHKVVR
jgi:dihydrodipicolinate synthase/N-acetylneuraminate lyase